MTLRISCVNPDCGASHEISDDQVGARIRCDLCGEEFATSLNTRYDVDGDSPVANGVIEGKPEGSYVPSEPEDLPPVFGRYRVLMKLGQGGMATVYQARDVELDRIVALKVPHEFMIHHPGAVDRFVREAKIAAGFRHPRFCPVHDVGRILDRPFISMAYIEGQTLSDFLKQCDRVSEAEAVSITRRLASAMAAAHERGIVHRDLKPANVMMESNGDLIIMDFGLARRSDGDDERITRPGAILGTPHYMSPEQVEGKTDEVGPRSDVYSLGVIFYELLTGRRPFEGSMTRVLGLIAVSEPPPPSQHLAALNPAIEKICLKAMAKRIEDRYASMGEFEAALAALTSLDRRRDPRTNEAVETTPAPIAIPASEDEASASSRPKRSALIGFVYGAYYLVFALFVMSPFVLGIVGGSQSMFGEFRHAAIASAVLFAVGGSLLMIPAGFAWDSPSLRKSLYMPLLGSGVCASLLCFGMMMSLMAQIDPDAPKGAAAGPVVSNLRLWLGVSVIGSFAGWIPWTLIFWISSAWTHRLRLNQRMSGMLFFLGLLEFIRGAALLLGLIGTDSGGLPLDRSGVIASMCLSAYVVFLALGPRIFMAYHGIDPADIIQRDRL